MPQDASDYILNFQLEDAPDAARYHLKRCLLDLIGVAAAGSRMPVSAIARRVAASQFAGTQARFLFDGATASASGAAFANAATIDGFDAHDGHPLTKGHAGCGCIAALVAFAGDGAAQSGREALGHLLIGYEVAIRAGIALHATAAEYHTTGAWVSVASASIGARMLGLDKGGLREAIGIAEYHGPRSQMMRCIDFPTMVKDGSGWGAMAGVMATYLAREGFTGAPAITVEGENVREFWNDFGERWRVTEQYLKPYPVCRWAQPAMEAAKALRASHSFVAQDVDRIVVRTFYEASKLAVASPRATDDAQYSLPFPLAALIVRGDVGPNEIAGPALKDAEILRLSNAVTLIDEPGYSERFPRERWADVEIQLKDGRRLQSEPTAPRGSADSPLSDQEVSQKFHALMTAAGFADRAAAVEDMVMTLDRAANFAPLVDAITKPADAASTSHLEAAQ